MSKAKVIIVALPICVIAGGIAGMSLGLGVLPSLALGFMLPITPFMIKPLSKGLVPVLKAIAKPPILLALLSSLSMLILGFSYMYVVLAGCIAPALILMPNILKQASKAMGACWKIISKPPVLILPIITMAAYALGYGPIQAILAGCAASAAILAPKIIKYAASMIQNLVSAILKFCRKAFALCQKGMKKISEVLEKIPLKPNLFLAGLAYALSRNFYVSLLSGIVAPSFIRVDKYAFIAMAFCMNSWIPEGLGLIQYAGSGFLEPLIIGLLVHKATEKFLIAYLNGDIERGIHKIEHNCADFVANIEHSFNRNIYQPISQLWHRADNAAGIDEAATHCSPPVGENLDIRPIDPTFVPRRDSQEAGDTAPDVPDPISVSRMPTPSHY
tara:strand:- start:39471 stop:40631 length:1161 start_codon:yes stop_codon:yes gene_type:complete